MAEVGYEAQKLVDRWRATHEAVQRAQQALERAQAEEQEAANELGRVMCPKDMGPDEVVTTWARLNPKQERLLSITRKDARQYEVRWRKPRAEDGTERATQEGAGTQEA